MRTSHVLWAGFGLLFFLAMFDTSVSEVAPPSEMAADPVAMVASDESSAPAQDSWGGGQLVLQRRPDGHFYASPRIAGSEIEMLVDTGASFIALTGDDARRAGLFWDASQLQPVARGASGPVFGVPVVLDRVELGSHVATQVPAAIVPEGLPVTLLGQSFLSRIDKVEISGDRMVLGGI